MSRFTRQVEPLEPTRALARALGALGVVIALLLAGCGSRASSAARLSDAVAPHEEAMLHFARWARFVMQAAGDDRARTSETLFAPVQDDPRFRALSVERLGRTPLRVAAPEGLVVPALEWQAIRSPRLGALEAAFDPIDTTSTWARLRADDALVITFELAPPP